MSVAPQNEETPTKQTLPFQYFITIYPLGFLYGSAGRFLSPENLVGRSGTSFPPSSATLSGVFAYQYQKQKDILSNLQLAGPFWAYTDNLDQVYVPTPMNCLVKDNQIEHIISWQENKWQTYQNNVWTIPPDDKYQNQTWINLSYWEHLQNPPSDLSKIPISSNPWKFISHLHPKLQKTERTTEEGELFLENVAQLDSNTCLVYLSNTHLPNGWYKFGGEGHLVEIESLPLGETLTYWLNQPKKRNFALITPGVWGTNRFSYRAPQMNPEDGELYWGDNKIEALLTQRAIAQRYRLGNRRDGHQEHQPKLLSRGRYAVPAGSVYILETPLNQAWYEWDEEWFPKEGPSFKRWGCGLALPL